MTTQQIAMIREARQRPASVIRREINEPSESFGLFAAALDDSDVEAEIAERAATLTPQALAEKYRPRRLAEVVGQPRVTGTLKLFAKNPYSTVFLMGGATGVGKTSCAMALAADLGCAIEHEELGGLRQIASGDQTADAVRKLRDQLAFIPFYGSGWRVCIINEADNMHPQAEAVWLDVLEKLPPRTVIIFTTNEPKKLSDRFRDRCNCLAFASKPEDLKEPVRRFLSAIWAREVGGDLDVSRLPAGIARDGHVSIRRAVQALEALIQQTQNAATCAAA